MLLDFEGLHRIVQALGWALVHFLWQGAVVGACFSLCMAALRRAAPRLRYACGLLSLALLAALPVATFLEALSTTAGAAPVPGLLSLPALALSPGGATPPQAWNSPMEAAMPWIVGAWSLGVLAHLLRVLVNWQRMRRVSRRGIRPVPDWLAHRAERLRAVFRVRRPVALFESSRVSVPTVLGWLKPVILLPTASLVGLTPRQLELVVAHELGHVRRWDYLVNVLQVCVETALFYHPVVGWISRRIREEREKCCDDLVVRRCGDELEYARALANLEGLRAGALRPALAASEGRLFERIERIVVGARAEPRHLAGGNSLLLVLIGLAAVVAVLDAQRARLADTLFEELLLRTVPSHGSAILAPLENARATFVAPSGTPPPVVETAREAPAGEAGAPVPAPAGGQAQAGAGGTQASPPAAGEAGTRPSPRRPPPPAGTGGTESAAPAVPPASAGGAPESGRDALPVLPEAPAPEVGAPSTPGPRILLRRAPDYPVRARVAGQTGSVTLSFSIDAEGRPVDIDIEEARPRRVFEKASLRALRQWRFDPNSVAAGDQRLIQRFDFSLQGGR